MTQQFKCSILPWVHGLRLLGCLPPSGQRHRHYAHGTAGRCPAPAPSPTHRRATAPPPRHTVSPSHAPPMQLHRASALPPPHTMLLSWQHRLDLSPIAAHQPPPATAEIGLGEGESVEKGSRQWVRERERGWWRRLKKSSLIAFWLFKAFYLFFIHMRKTEYIYLFFQKSSVYIWIPLSHSGPTLDVVPGVWGYLHHPTMAGQCRPHQWPPDVNGEVDDVVVLLTGGRAHQDGVLGGVVVEDVIGVEIAYKLHAAGAVGGGDTVVAELGDLDGLCADAVGNQMEKKHHRKFKHDDPIEARYLVPEFSCGLHLQGIDYECSFPIQDITTYQCYNNTRVDATSSRNLLLC